jgi:hypothetical protein
MLGGSAQATRPAVRVQSRLAILWASRRSTEPFR